MASQSRKECLGTKPFDHISLCQGTFRPLDHIQHTRCGEGSPRIPLPVYRIFPTWIGSSINWCLFSYLLPEALHIMNRPVPSSILSLYSLPAHSSDFMPSIRLLPYQGSSDRGFSLSTAFLLQNVVSWA